MNQIELEERYQLIKHHTNKLYQLVMASNYENIMLVQEAINLRLDAIDHLNLNKEKVL